MFFEFKRYEVISISCIVDEILERLNYIPADNIIEQFVWESDEVEPFLNDDWMREKIAENMEEIIQCIKDEWSNNEYLYN